MFHFKHKHREEGKQAGETNVRFLAALWLMVGGICVVLANSLAAGLK